jgi:hypothetical protein
MEWQVCKQCGVNKEAIRANYEFRNDNNKFRTICKTCSNDNDLRERYIEKCVGVGIDKDSITEYEPKILLEGTRKTRHKILNTAIGNENALFCP